MKKKITNSPSVWMLDGKPLAGWCKKCGEFTLDVVSLLCVSCSLVEVIQNIQQSLAGYVSSYKGGIENENQDNND